MDSVMDLSDTSVIILALKCFRGFKLPKINEDIRLKAAETRLELAEYYYNNVKTRLEKGKKVSEEELNLTFNKKKSPTSLSRG